jgi:hypothetical protein
MRKSWKLLLVILGMPFVVHADDGIAVQNGFITGNTFRALDQASKNVYATGLIDGILLAPLYGAPEERLNNFEQCTVGMTGQQVVAIFGKYLKNNPERWHNSMHVIAFSALREACS